MEEVDDIVRHRVSQCQECGTSLVESPVEEWDLRQVQDLPPIGLQVTEHQAEGKVCPVCSKHNRGEFPVEVNSVVQYGATLKGLMVYLLDAQLLPSERVCDLLGAVVGCEVSEGTLYNARERCYEQLAAVESQTIEAMQGVEVGHFDETGIRVNGKLWWLHVACTDALTYYFIHAKRGKLAMEQMNILPKFQGISVHDGWQSYAHYECEHGLCNAHHLRELRFIAKRYQQEWAEQMMRLLVEIKHWVEQAKASGRSRLEPDQVRQFEERYQLLIGQGLKVNPPKPDRENPKPRGRPKQSPAKNLLERLKSRQSAVLALMYDLRVPFDNNQAERDIRMMKLKQKISGGFRSLEGAQMFCRIRGCYPQQAGARCLSGTEKGFYGYSCYP